jgi:hypothetical protein
VAGHDGAVLEAGAPPEADGGPVDRRTSAIVGASVVTGLVAWILAANSVDDGVDRHGVAFGAVILALEVLLLSARLRTRPTTAQADRRAWLWAGVALAGAYVASLLPWGSIDTTEGATGLITGWMHGEWGDLNGGGSSPATMSVAVLVLTPFLVSTAGDLWPTRPEHESDGSWARAQLGVLALVALPMVATGTWTGLLTPTPIACLVLVLLASVALAAREVSAGARILGPAMALGAAAIGFDWIHATLRARRAWSTDEWVDDVHATMQLSGAFAITTAVAAVLLLAAWVALTAASQRAIR